MLYPDLQELIEEYGVLGLKTGANIDWEIDFDDLDELKEHPVLSEFVGMNLNAVLEKMSLNKAEL